jgi:hypothetical protein
MLYEVRRYRMPTFRHLAPLVRFAGDHLVPGLRTAGVQVIGCFTTVIGPQPGLSLILAFPDANAWQDQLVAFEASDTWRAMEPSLFPDGQSLITGYQTILLRPTLFSTDLVQALDAPQPGVFEERIYYPVDSRAYARLATRFATGTVPVFRRLGMDAIGLWEIVAGADIPGLYYLMRHSTLAERMPQWDAYNADPERMAITAAAEADGPLIARTELSILQPTSFSPLR